MTPDTTLAKFVVDNLADFREAAEARDHNFFQAPENVAAFRDFAQALPYIWMGQQTQNNLHLAGVKPANRQAL